MRPIEIDINKLHEILIEELGHPSSGQAIASICHAKNVTVETSVQITIEELESILKAAEHEQDSIKNVLRKAILQRIRQSQQGAPVADPNPADLSSKADSPWSKIGRNEPC